MAKRMTVIRGGRLLDVAKRRAEPADILIAGDTIREIGRPGLAAPADAVAIDARRRLLHPGLINAHTHAHGNLAKGMGDRWTLELLLTAGPMMTGNRTAEDKYLTTLIGAAESLLKGCTAVYDLTVEFPMPSVEGLAAGAQAYADAGIRAVVAPMVADRSLFEAIPGLMDRLTPGLCKEVEQYRLAPYKLSVKNIRAALKGWSHAADSVRPAIAPTIPHHCSDDFIADCVKLAREFGVGLHTHVAESKTQVIAGYRLYGKSLAAHMDDMGAVGPDFTVAHGVWLDDDDMALLGRRGASVAHNPGSNMRLGSGLADAIGMLRHGVNLAIGTDGANCADNQNMYEAMRLASLVSKVRSPDIADWLTTDQVFHAATVGSARALGFEGKLGRIEKGYKADIVFLDLDHINWIPLNDPVNQIVHTEDAGAVHSVMVGGKMAVENRRLVNVDLAKLASQAEAARARLAALNKPHAALYKKLEKTVASYCSGLCHEPLHFHRYGAPLGAHRIGG
jgi:guanine deaminase